MKVKLGDKNDWYCSIYTCTQLWLNPELSGTRVSNKEACPAMEKGSHWTGGLEVLSFSHIPLDVVRE